MTNTGTKKRRFRRVESKITAKGARAIFYRQFLEYKKEKYFIFTKMTVLSAVVAFIFAYSLQNRCQTAVWRALFCWELSRMWRLL